ncbi:MAG: CoA-binding protein [Candidatus Woesearchaeota archaeon]
MENKDQFSDFFRKDNLFAVVGVSQDTSKYGRIVYDDLKKNGYKVTGVNPNVDTIEGEKIHNSLEEMTDKAPDVVVFVVPPKVVESYLETCKGMGIDKIWLQPGSESQKAIDFCENNDIRCLHDRCIMLNLQ